MDKNKVIIKDLKIQAKILRDNVGYYKGYVYKPEFIDDKSLLNYLNVKLEPGWNEITTGCITKAGCKYELRKWKKDHFVYTLEI